MKRSRRQSRKNDQRRAFLFFLAGVAAGLTIFIFYKIFTLTPYLPPRQGVPEVPRFKVAVVLDDFGYNYKNVEAVFKLKRPITFSILPHHPYSKIISRRVYEKGCEEILHLPLEPYKDDKYVRPELDVITTDMKKLEVLERLAKALVDVPYAKGVSNHQGSKATEDTALMQVIFTELKERKLFFLDSLVTNKSVCKKVAKNIGIGFGRRSVFLDNKEEFEYIKGQMQQLIKRAKRNGAAIGIGHDREKTVLALSKLMPEAEEEGVEFVFLSELIR